MSAQPELVDHFRRMNVPRHPDAKALLGYWRTKIDSGEGFVIGRDVPTRSIARLLGNIMITEPIAGVNDMRVYLAGARIRDRFGGDITGRKLSEIFPPKDFQHHQALSVEIMRTGQPAIIDSRMHRSGIDEMQLEVILLPVTARDLVSAWVMAGVFYYR